jgi:hypothetical protein
MLSDLPASMAEQAPPADGVAVSALSNGPPGTAPSAVRVQGHAPGVLPFNLAGLANGGSATSQQHQIMPNSAGGITFSLDTVSSESVAALAAQATMFAAQLREFEARAALAALHSMPSQAASCAGQDAAQQGAKSATAPTASVAGYASVLGGMALMQDNEDRTPDATGNRSPSKLTTTPAAQGGAFTPASRLAVASAGAGVGGPPPPPPPPPQTDKRSSRLGEWRDGVAEDLGDKSQSHEVRTCAG